MVKLRSFDAFPKLSDAYQTQSQPNNPMLYVLLFVGLFLVYFETTNWMSLPSSHQFEVDKGINDRFQINMEITVRNKCSDVGIYIQDASDDQLFVNELVKFAPYFPDPESSEEWCQLAGIFDTNRVKGRLTIMGNHRFGTSKPFDTTHAITELSFGEYYPEVVNPLDYTSKKFDEPTLIAYFISIVPTRYRMFGLELETYQYSYNERTRGVSRLLAAPQITFDYNFDPIKVDISDSRMSFFQWLLRVVNIVGGLVFATRALFRLFKRKMKSGDGLGLLDQPLKRN